MKLHLFFIVLITLVLACNSTQTTDNTQTTSTSSLNVSFIDQPLKNVAPVKQVFTFQNAKGLVQKTSRHSLITVPENAFVLEDGTPIEGELSIEFQEIFNPAEIILSGIPMNVEKDGQTMPFISDGMFSITASCQGKTAKLAEGKSIAVSTSSQKENTDFDYWYFNEKEGEWENLGDRTSVLSPEQVIEKSVELNPAETESFVNTNSPTDRTAFFASNTEKPTEKVVKKPLAPKAHNPNDFVFNISASYTDYPELAAYKNVLWKPVLSMDKKEQKALQTGMQQFGANVYLECKNPETQLYTIHYGSKSIEACPVFIGADRKKALASYNAKMETYAKKLKEEADVQKIAQKAADQYVKTYNMFAVNRMGIYNCDRFYSNPNQNNYTFRSQDKTVDQHIFAVLKDNEGVIALSSSYKQGDHYKLPGKDIIGFVHTNAQGVVCYAKNDGSKLKGNSNNEVNLTIHDKMIEKPEELQKLIQSL